jgi:hypothetical protein
LVSGWDWVFSVAYMLAFMYVFLYVFLVKTTYTWLADRNSPYAFAERAMRRFNVQSRPERRNSLTH